MRFLDTNVAIRYLTQDDPVKGQACTALFRRVDAGTEEITTCEAVIAEIVYVLSAPSLYALGRSEVHTRLTALLGLRGWRLPSRRTYLRALDLYAAQPQLDFEDALILAHAENEGVGEVLSYDRGLDRAASVKRVEP